MYLYIFRSILLKTARLIIKPFRIIRIGFLTLKLKRLSVKKINICCGNQKIPGYFGIDFVSGADLCLDLSKNDLPFQDNSIDSVVCMSAINYFTHTRAKEIVREVYRVLRSGGVVRFLSVL